MWHRFGRGMRLSVLKAVETSEQLGESCVSTARLLWAVIQTTDCSAARILARLGVTDVPSTKGKPETGNEPGLTAEARRAVEEAYQEALDLGDDYIGAEHLLLAFVRQPECEAGQTLAQAGVGLPAFAREMMRVQTWRRFSPQGTQYPRLRARKIKFAVRAFGKRTGQLAFALTHLQKPFMPFLLFRQKTIANPYPFHRRLRKTPLYWDDLVQQWIITGYREVAAVLQEPRFSHRHFELASWNMDDLPPLVQREFRTLNSSIARQMLFQDAPDHPRLRSLVSKQFTPRVIENMRAGIQGITDGLLDRVAATGRMDVIADLAFPLPARTIARMLGVPEEDSAYLKKWSDDFFVYIGGRTTLAQDLAARRSLKELTAYFRAAIARLRPAPQEDLLSLLIQAEEQGDRLSEEELIDNCLLLLAAGHETTTQLVGNGLLALLQNPAQMEKLRREPDGMTRAVEEFLRYDSPVQWTSRVTREDFEWESHRFQKGQMVGLCLAAANRDPAQFPDPDRLDIARGENRHLAFGYGSHFCLGAALARMEGQIALTSLLHRFPDLRLGSRNVEWQNNFTFRALKSLSVVWTPPV